MNVVAACQVCSSEIYVSSLIKAERHALNAWLKATRLAQAHCAATGHDVEVRQGERTALVAARCALCGTATPGRAAGICEFCLRKRLEDM